MNVFECHQSNVPLVARKLREVVSAENVAIKDIYPFHGPNCLRYFFNENEMFTRVLLIV